MSIGLILGDFDLFGDGDTWRCETLAAGTDLSGNPQSVEVAIQTLIQDGSVAYTEKFDNATLPVVVCLSGPDAEALDEGAAALFAELNRPNVLTYTGPQAFGPIAWDVVNSHLERNSDDLAEVRGDRYYTIVLTVLPFRRGTELTTTEALPVAGTDETVLDTCSANTGWTGFVDGVSTAVVNASGVNKVTSAPVSGPHVVAQQKTFAADTSTENLLWVDWLPSIFGGSLEAFGDGQQLKPIAEVPSPTAGLLRNYFYVDAASLDVTRFEWTSTAFGHNDAGAPVRALSISGVGVTDKAPVLGTGRQRIRTVEVGGSARTPASLAVESETAALGNGTMVYVYPADASTNAYSPSMQQFRVSGNTVNDSSSRVSGHSESLTGSGVTFDVPVGLFPRGTYQLCGLLATSGGGNPRITYAAKTALGASGLNQIDGTSEITTTTAYQMFALGNLELPTIDLDPGAGSLASMSLTVSADSTCTYDELWLVNLTIGRLLLVDCGTGSGAVGGAARRLFIDPATLASQRPTIRVGHSADRSDSYFPVAGVLSWMFPEFKPRRMTVLTVTPNAVDAAVSMQYYERLAG